MCHFITATHSVNINLADINKIAQPFALKFKTCNNEFVGRQISQGDAYISKHSNTCDCGTSMGEASGIKQTAEKLQKTEVDKLMKKGWTESKIKRWLTDKKKNEKKVTIENYAAQNGITNEIANWVAFLQLLFTSTNIEHFGILLHWYSNSLHDEDITIENRKSISYKNLAEMDFKILKENILLCVGR